MEEGETCMRGANNAASGNQNECRRGGCGNFDSKIICRFTSKSEKAIQREEKGGKKGKGSRCPVHKAGLGEEGGEKRGKGRYESGRNIQTGVPTP
jgi:hypothetical protein